MRADSAPSFLQLGFLVRKGPTARMIQELNATDLADFRREREAHEKMVEAALPADDKAAWDSAAGLRDADTRASCAICTDSFLDARFALTERRRTLDRWLETATAWGFILQQLGFVIVLLAGLVHQHGAEPKPRPPCTMTAAGDPC